MATIKHKPFKESVAYKKEAQIKHKTLKKWDNYDKMAKSYACIMSKFHSSHFAVHTNNGQTIKYFEVGVDRRGVVAKSGLPPAVFDIATTPNSSVLVDTVNGVGRRGIETGCRRLEQYPSSSMINGRPVRPPTFEDIRRGFTDILYESLTNDFEAWRVMVDELRKAGIKVPENADNMTFDDFVEDRLHVAWEKAAQREDWRRQEDKETPKYA